MELAQNYQVPLFITSLGEYTGFAMAATVGGGFAPANSTWPLANRAIYIPFFLPFAYPANRLFLANGGATAGNIDLGLYNHDGKKIYSSGSTAMSGTNVLQYVTSSVMLSPGRYYFGASASSASAQVIRVSFGVLGMGKLTGMLQEASAFPLPATFTPATIGSQFLPLVGLTMTTTGF